MSASLGTGVWSFSSLSLIVAARDAALEADLSKSRFDTSHR